MSVIPTQGQSILIDTPENSAGMSNATAIAPGNELTSWLLGKVTPWESFRNRGYQRRWGEYWRMWRGMWSAEDRNRLSERSRLIAPAMAQAIEMTVSEIEEGVFSRENWFDVADDVADQDKLDANIARDNLIEDFELSGVKDQVSESVLNAAIFGTGVIKLDVQVVKESTPVRGDDGRLKQSDAERVVVVAESIRPDEFIPDPSGKCISDMLGCFHKMSKPRHAILESIEQGKYRKDAMPFLMPGHRDNTSDIDPHDPESLLAPGDAEQVTVLEYHGKIPARMLSNISNRPRSPVDDLLDAAPQQGDGPMVEAIVTIANGSVLLRAMANPFVMKDRSIIAFQFEKVPGRFWGRGVSEKGFNPQKALDAEMRARVDALGFISSPMIGVDSGRIPRGFKMEVKPGKVWLTQGPPNEIIRPVDIGQLNAGTFNQTQELERMVSMGTGAFDTASGLKQQGGQSNGPSGTNVSMMMGAFVKRAKRAIRNVNDNLLYPMITKSLWRYMQFDPNRYPSDFKFVVKPTLGMVAREVEAMQLTQLMGMLPEQFPQVSVAVAQGIVELSNLHTKGKIVQAMEAALAPPPKEEQEKQQMLADMQLQAQIAEAQGALLNNQMTLANIRKTLNQAEVEARKADTEDVKVQQEQQRINIQFAELEQFEQQNQIAMQRLELQRRQLEAKLAEPTTNT